MPFKDPNEERAYQAAYRVIHRAERIVYRAAHLEEAKARTVDWRAAHPEEVKARNAANYAAHREEKKAYARAYAAAHREERNAYNTIYRLSHREKAKARLAAYRAAKPEVHRVACARREARKKGLPATLTAEQWEAIKRAYRYRCAYCGKKPRLLTQDHVVPIKHGGGTTAENIVPACARCNAAKGARAAPSIPPIRLLV